MQWLSQNWVWVFFFVAFVAMHLFGHGGHGGHGRLSVGTPVDQNGTPPEKGDVRGRDSQASQHRH